MVQITPEEVMEKRRRATQFDDMPSWKRELIGSSTRLQIPLSDVHLLRKIAPLVGGLSEFIAFTSRRTDLDEYNLLMSVRHEIKATNKQIAQMHGGAFPNGVYRKLRLD